MVGKSKWIDNKGEDFDNLDDFQKQDWLDERVGPNGAPLVLNSVVNEINGWKATQVWGFSLVNGERRYTRRVVIGKIDGSETLKVRLLYDWAGK